MTPDDSPTDQPPDPEGESDAPSAVGASAETGDTATAAGAGRDGDGEGDAGGESKTRDVVVPMRVYKAVTVFTTLFAVATVVGGFIVLDTATNRARATLADVDPLLALLGVGLIVAGAAAYAFSTRFRAEGMGKSKDDTDEVSDNG